VVCAKEGGGVGSRDGNRERGNVGAAVGCSEGGLVGESG
jgi:hypothetical protein